MSLVLFRFLGLQSSLSLSLSFIPLTLVFLPASSFSCYSSWCVPLNLLTVSLHRYSLLLLLVSSLPLLHSTHFCQVFLPSQILYSFRCLSLFPFLRLFSLKQPSFHAASSRFTSVFVASFIGRPCLFFPFFFFDSLFLRFLSVSGGQERKRERERRGSTKTQRSMASHLLLSFRFVRREDKTDTLAQFVLYFMNFCRQEKEESFTNPLHCLCLELWAWKC